MRLLLVLLLSGFAFAQVAEKANERYKSAEGRHGVASGLISPDRDARQKPKDLTAALKLKPGMTVADFGTGAGYLLPHLSAAVGPQGRVLAQDIHADFLDRARKTAAGLNNVEFFQGGEKESNLPDGSADVILALDVYHHLNYPEASLADLRRKLKKDGRLVVVEYHKNEKSMGGRFALEHIRLGEEDAIKEIERNGFKLVSRRDFSPEIQWIAEFQPRL